MHISISAIIPIYNVSKYIERCTRTLMEQSFQNVEFIFVNDCTPDNSIEILRNTLRDYPHRHPFVKIINNPKNLGLAATRFVGMSEAKGDYVWHCDSDDWVEKDMLQKMYDKAIIEDADIVCCEATKEYTDHSILCKYDYDKETLENGIVFALNSPDGDQGLPGNFKLSVTYTVTAENGLKIDYDGISDKDLNTYSKCAS